MKSKSIIKMKNSVLYQKSFRLALDVLSLTNELKKRQEYVLSNQLLKSGTSIGANIREAVHAESLYDFAHKMSVSLKECAETEYWLELALYNHPEFTHQISELMHANKEIYAMLSSTIITCRKKILTRKESAKKQNRSTPNF